MKKKTIIWISVIAAVLVIEAFVFLGIGKGMNKNPAQLSADPTGQGVTQGESTQPGETTLPGATQADTTQPGGTVTQPQGESTQPGTPADPDAPTQAGEEGATQESTQGATDPSQSATEATKPGTQGGTEAGTEATEPLNTEPDIYRPQVTFLRGENATTFRVEPGTIPEFPSGQSGYDHLVFTGWNKAITAVVEDTVYEAVYEDITGKSNVFVLDTVYTTDNSAKLTLSLRGDVKLSVADFQIKYDPTVLRVEEIINADPSIRYNIMPEEGRVKISMMMEGNLTAGMDCFQLRVSLVGGSVGKLDIVVDDAAYLESGNQKDAATNAISGKLVKVS